VKGSAGGQERGWVRESGGLFRDDQNNTTDDASLRALAATEGPLTYTCAPPGSGSRMGINRDEDLHLDGLDNCPAVANDDQADPDDDDELLDTDEAMLGTNPFDPDSDGDGFTDGREVQRGTNPLDPDSYPFSEVLAPPLAARGVLTPLLLGAGSLAVRRRESGTEYQP
jgi:hypothetical protein